MPRSLVPIGQWPLISYVIRWFQTAGISSATVCANSASRMVRKGLGDGSRLGMELDYYEDWVPRGPAGCVRDAGLQSDADVFVVADATTIPWLDLPGLLEFHRASGAAMTAVLGREVEQGPASGTCLVPEGIYVWGRQVLDFIRETGYQDIKEVLIPRLHESGMRVQGYVMDGSCLRVTDVGSYLTANQTIIRQISEQETDLPEYDRIGEGYIHRTVQCDGEVNFIGPVLVGPGTRIGREVTIVGPTAIGAQGEIGRGTIIGRSVLWDRCLVGEQCRIDGCLLTTGAAVVSKTVLTRALHHSTAKERNPVMNRWLNKLRQFEKNVGQKMPKTENISPGSIPPSPASTARAVSTTSL
jgi:mannose-1-phosphate guanylyltransferase / phosphomannomutase